MEVASTSDIMPYTHAAQANAQHRSKSLRRVLSEIAVRREEAAKTVAA
jgi:hypothetical protein